MAEIVGEGRPWTVLTLPNRPVAAARLVSVEDGAAVMPEGVRLASQLRFAARPAAHRGSLLR